VHTDVHTDLPSIDPEAVVRVDPGRLGARVIAGVLVLGVALAGYSYWTGRATTTSMIVGSGSPLAATSRVGAPAGVFSTEPPASASPGDSTVVVYVVGPVRRSGVFRLPAGSRVIDALRLAGGLRAGRRLGPVNLAALLVDGSRLDFASGDGAQGSGQSGSGSSSSAGSSSAAAESGPINLNRATLADLDGLPGVGPVLAQRILDWRGEHGRFSSIEELREVSGIGERKFESLRPHVRV